MHAMPSFRTLTHSQFRAALAMLEQCITRCPDEHWDATIGKYPFWQVVYHTLCFVDCYLSPSNDDFTRTVEARQKAESAGAPPPAFNPQPRGMAELDDEYPSRRFTREEMIQYAAICRAKLDATIPNESDETLDGPSGFPWLAKLSRAELHLYNLRHVCHHTGQLSAALRRVGVETGWVKAG